MKRQAITTLLRLCRGRVLLLAALTLLISLLQVAMALLSRMVIDTALAAGGEPGTWIGLYAAAVLVLVGVYALAAWLSGSTADLLSAKLRKDLLHSAVHSRDLRLQQFHSGQLLSRGMEDVQILCDGVVHALPSLVGNLTKLAAAFAAMFLISPKVALVLALVAATLVLGTAFVRPILKKHHRQVRESDETVMSTMQEDLQQLELIQSLQVQKKLMQRFADRVKENLRLRTHRRILSVSSNSILSTVSLLGSGAVLIWGAVQVAQGVLSFGMLTAMLQLLGMLTGPVLGLSGTWTRLTAVEVAAGRLQDLLNAPEEEQKRVSVANVSEIVFADVTFAYPGDETPVLEHFSARIPLERWACLTGISGKGKTTLFKLILGLYAPQSGRVYLQTEEGELPCSEQTRHLFAHVPQDYALFSGNVEENLELVTDRDPNAWRSALALAQADFLTDLQTQVRENNMGLSKGQLQRIAIARAVLMERPILLLDECTSALDAQTERSVLESLHALGTQAVLVTHRPQSLADFSEICSVDI